MKLRDARKLVNRLNYAEIAYYAAVGLAYDSNMMSAEDEQSLVAELRQRSPALTCRTLKTSTHSPKVRSAP